jgi:hypothetical protein
MRLVSLFCLLVALAGICAAQDTNFALGPQYLITSGSPEFERPIATPSLSLGEAQAASTASFPAEVSVEPQPSPLPPELQYQADLTRVYWGEPKIREIAGEIEIISAEPASPLPASILDVGVTGMVDPQFLRERGYGMSLAEAGAFWKMHKPAAPRVYTNRDIERLHGG